jgi:hypothetical protein
VEVFFMSGNRKDGIGAGELATILGGGFLFNYAIMLLWFIVYLAAPDWLYGMNSRWFPVTRHEFDLVNYYGIAIYKVINIAFFLSPYLALKSLQRWGRRS